MKEMMIIKRTLLLFLVIGISTFCVGQKVILLKKLNGVYNISCSINGVKKSLVFDTGASTVTISMQLAELLYKTGKLKKTDFKGFGRSQTASGQIVNNMAIVLRDIEIAGLHIRNVDAVVIEGQNVPLLLGLSAIQKLGKVSLTGNKLIINSPLLANSQLNEMRSKIVAYINKNEYKDAIILLNKIEVQDAVEEIDIFHIAKCYCYLNDYNKTLMYCQQWMGTYKSVNPQHVSDICSFMALAYKGLKNYFEADKWFSQAINSISVESVDRTSILDAQKLSIYYNQKALNYLEAEAYDYCVEAFDIATQFRMRVLGVTPDDLCAGVVKDKKIGTWLQSISTIYAVFIPNELKAKHYAVLAALCGNKEAIDFCNYYNIDINTQTK